MKAFFEATRAINEKRKTVPRSFLHYFIMPQAQTVAKFSANVSQNLERLKIVTRNRSSYYVLDYEIKGRTFSVLDAAIKSINKQAIVRPIT